MGSNPIPCNCVDEHETKSSLSRDSQVVKALVSGTSGAILMGSNPIPCIFDYTKCQKDVIHLTSF